MIISLRKQLTFREIATWALAKQRLSNECRNSILMLCTTQILVVLLIGEKKIPSWHNQSEALPRSGKCTSSVWNFCARYSDVVLQGLKWRPRKTSAVFSGYMIMQNFQMKESSTNWGRGIIFCQRSVGTQILQWWIQDFWMRVGWPDTFRPLVKD